MDEPVMAELIISKETTVIPTNGNVSKIEPAPSLQQLVRNSAEFGWLVAELLGRCFLLQQMKPPDPSFDGEKLVMLEGLLTPRQRLLGVVSHMCYLAKTLGIDTCAIEPPDEENGKTFAETISASVTQLCLGTFDSGKNQTFETVRGQINERLFYWDLKINEALQNGPGVIAKAYLIGYCLGGMRWWYGVPDIQLDKTFKTKVLQYLPRIGPQLSQFAQMGLATSIDPWWDAIAKYESMTTMPTTISDGQQADGLAPPELQKQGSIWYSLLTGEADALSYVDPSIRNRPYIWQVFHVAWPFFVLSFALLLLVFGCAAYIFFMYSNQIVKEATGVISILAAFGIAQTVQKMSGDIFQKAIAGVDATIKGSYLDRVWNATLQQAVNKAVFVLPPVPDKKTQASQSSAKK